MRLPKKLLLFLLLIVVPSYAFSAGDGLKLPQNVKRLGPSKLQIDSSIYTIQKTGNTFVLRKKKGKKPKGPKPPRNPGQTLITCECANGGSGCTLVQWSSTTFACERTDDACGKCVAQGHTSGGTTSPPPETPKSE